MNLAFINPGYKKYGNYNRDVMGGFGAVSTKGDIKIPPLGLLYGASIALEKGFECKFIDAEAEKLENNEIYPKIKDCNAAFINLGAASLSSDIKLINQLIGNGLEVYTTGPSARFYKRFLIKEASGVNVLNGELEFILPFILDYYKTNLEKNKIPSLTYLDKESGETIETDNSKSFVEDLESLPFPARQLLKKNLYRGFYPHERPLATAQTSRGCPFNCVYCPYPISQGRRWRSISHKRMLEEAKILKEEFGYRYILYRDALFTNNKERTIDFCEGIIESNLDLKWRCETAFSKVDTETLSFMAKAGCSGINFGLESADPNQMKQYAMKTGGLDRVFKITKTCKELGIEVLFFIILGLPGETLKTIKKTQETIVKLNPDHLIVSSATPYPGTKIFELMKSQKEIAMDDLKSINSFDTHYLPEGLSKEELKREIFNTYKKLYFRPRRVFKELLVHPSWFVGNCSQAVYNYVKLRKKN